MNKNVKLSNKVKQSKEFGIYKKIKTSLKIIVVFCLVFVISMSAISAYKTMAEIIYIGGSSSAGSGKVGNWTISVPENYLALKIGIDKKLNTEETCFAKTGYSNCYPDVGDNYIILVPANGYKVKTVLADMNTLEFTSSHVIYGGEGGAKSAVWNLFMKNTPTYKGDAKTLIGNTEPSDWTSYITTESFNDIGIDNDFLNSTNGKMIVSNDLVTDKTLNRQVALTGIAICQAINEGGGNLNLEDVCKYFLGKQSVYEYIVVIENVACMMDTANKNKGYWWIDNLTALSASLGMRVDPNTYDGSTNNFFKGLINEGDPIQVQQGTNKIGYRLNTDNQVKKYLFNYWYTPTYGNNYWSLNAISSCLWYSRKELGDDATDKTIWKSEFDINADGTDMTSDVKFGFNVLACFAYAAIESKEEIVTITINYLDDRTKEKLVESIVVPVPVGMNLEDVEEVMSTDIDKMLEQRNYHLTHIDFINNDTNLITDITDWWLEKTGKLINSNKSKD